MARLHSTRPASRGAVPAVAAALLALPLGSPPALASASAEPTPGGLPGAATPTDERPLPRPGCRSGSADRAASTTPARRHPAPASDTAEPQRFRRARARMIRDQLQARGITDEQVLAAMDAVPRQDFVDSADRELAYGDHPLPIGSGQTISQPYIVAYMTQLLDLDPDDKVLEIGTGSGYQAAVLARITPHVYTIELREPLYRMARERLIDYGLDADHVRLGDGYKGIPDHAPYDAIVVTAAPPEIPQALIDQLAKGGRMVVPVGPTNGIQYLTVVERDSEGEIHRRDDVPVRFVPMTRGESGAGGP